MPSIDAEVSFLVDAPLYEDEKPYLVLLQPGIAPDPSIPRSNLLYETHNVSIQDIRSDLTEHRIENCGFQIAHHESQVTFTPQINKNDIASVNAYKKETENMLKDELNAVHVVCYDFRLRENQKMPRDEIDLGDPLLIEGPAYGAHNDVTVRSGSEMIRRHLSADDQEKYIRQGYRFQIVK